jgi:hypothetical protein
MDSEVMYTLGQITRCAFPDGAEPELIDVILVQPATGLAKVMRSPTANYAGEDLDRLVSRLPDDLSDPKGGVKIEDQGPFWLGYYQWMAAVDKAKAYGPAELSEAGQALYGERWQTGLARDLGIADARRVRQWMTGDRPIPAGVWADIARLLRQRGLNAISLSGKLEK